MQSNAVEIAAFGVALTFIMRTVEHDSVLSNMNVHEREPHVSRKRLLSENLIKLLTSQITVN